MTKKKEVRLNNSFGELRVQVEYVATYNEIIRGFKALEVGRIK